MRIPNKRNGDRKNDDGSVSTHLFTTLEVGGKHYAVPTLFQDENDKWEELNPRDAFDRAMRNGEAEEFSSAEEADKYAKGSWKESYNEIYGDPAENSSNKMSSNGDSSYFESDAYKKLYEEGNETTRMYLDGLKGANKLDEVMSLVENITNGNARNINEAVEYNQSIDDKQLGIDQFSDKTRMALQAGNLVGKASRINKIDREASEDVDKNTQAILNNVMPQIKKSQALQQALGSAQYGAQAGLPPEVMGALNSANQVATANAMNAASGTGAIGLIHNNALANARRLAVDGLQYKGQQQQLLGNLAGQEQAINTRQGGIDAQGELEKLRLMNRIAEEGREVGRSMDVERDALGDTLSYMIPNGTRKAMEIAALNNIRNRETFSAPDTSAIGREVGASFANFGNLGTDGFISGANKAMEMAALNGIRNGQQSVPTSNELGTYQETDRAMEMAALNRIRNGQRSKGINQGYMPMTTQSTTPNSIFDFINTEENFGY